MSGPATTPERTFFVAGGTLRPDAPSYIVRKADQELLEGLLAGEFCYVLTPRQMGKSSLMVRTVGRLRKAGIGVAVLDLTAIGQNVTVEQWYGGLLLQLGQQLDFEHELIDFWRAQPLIGPMQRWILALRSVVLPRYPGRLVIFIDEIDVVRSLPFSVDEFFAGIRECYNQRSRDHELDRLGFCLLGVAAPTDLARDARTTPFNIGRRIELHDFTPEEARPLALGLQENKPGPRLVNRVLYWTHGHPYLTQRLCQAATEEANGDQAESIDDLCGKYFLAPRAHERDDNLLFVRERMLHSEPDRASLLDLYRQVRTGKTVRDDETNPLITALRLSGITRTEKDRLTVRNRIYSRVFNPQWIDIMMPEAELRRQRAAYRRGILRATLISALVLLLVGALAFIAVGQRQKAKALAEDTRRVLYDRRMELAQRQWDDADVGAVEQTLKDSLPQPGQQDLRSFEWFVFWRFTRGESLRRKEAYPIATIAIPKDGTRLAIAESVRTNQGGNSYLLKSYDAITLREISSFSVPSNAEYPYSSVAFSSDGQRAVFGDVGHTASLWDVASGQKLRDFKGHEQKLSSVALSADGQLLASADMGGAIKVWDTSTAREITTLTQGRHVVCMAFSPDGRILATVNESESVKLWNTRSWREMPSINDAARFSGAMFFPDGRQLLTSTQDGNLQVWDMTTRKKEFVLVGHRKPATAFAFSPDGKTLATGSYDKTVILWSLNTGQRLRTIKGHGSAVLSLAWPPEGSRLVTSSVDNWIKVWDLQSTPDLIFPTEKDTKILATAFSPADELMALGTNGGSQVKLWNLTTGQEIAQLDNPGSLQSAAFSPGQKFLATGGLRDHLVKIWDTTNGRLIKSFQGHTADVRGIAFSPDSELLVSGSAQDSPGQNGALWLWSMTGAEPIQLPGKNNAWTASFSHTGQFVAYATRDGSVQLWDVGRRQVIREFHGHTQKVRAITFSPDDSWLVTSGEDKTLRLWDVATAKQLNELGVVDTVQRVAFSPDGLRLVAGGVDGTVAIWDMVSRQKLLNLDGHSQPVTSVTFSADGTRLATSGEDRVVRLWHAATKKEVAEAQ